MAAVLPQVWHRFHWLLIEPRSREVDTRRREFILNTLLSGLLAVATIAVIVTFTNALIIGAYVNKSSLVETLLFWGIVTVLLIMSRRGRPQAAAFAFAGFLLLSSVLFALSWSYRLAQVELMFALTIVIIGVLFRAPLALTASLVVACSLIVISYLQISGLQVPYTDWEDSSLEAVDAIGYIVTFIIIGLVSWLSNYETDRALKRARLSERALQIERDSLENKVAERTYELEELQVSRLLEMQPFAEFGRIGASLVHDIANPLTAASMHLKELSRQQHSELVLQVQRNLHYLEKYLIAARKQIKRESELRVFSVGAELKQIVQLMSHRARRANVELMVDKITNMKLYGDVVKFNQLIANLIANAIDASEKVDGQQEVYVRVMEENGKVVISVRDHGVGITPEQAEHIFEPFYSTKSTTRRGLGLGLALVKRYVEHDYNGTIDVTSNADDGTIFTVRLEGQKNS